MPILTSVAGRHVFGGTVADWVFTTGSGGQALVAGGAAVQFYDSLTGGTRYTDLTDTALNPAVTVTTDANGELPEFYGPPNVWMMAADANTGAGPRRWLLSQDLTKLAGLLPSGDTTGASDTANITALENFGAQVVNLAAGTFWVDGSLTKQANTTWQGAGRALTIIKLANGKNAPVLSSAGFAALTMTGATAGGSAGPGGFTIRDLAFDGNSANQTVRAGAGVRLYGYDYLLDNVAIRNVYATDALYTEWGLAGGGIGSNLGPDNAMESRFRALRVHDNDCTGAGWHNRGPHDSQISNTLIYNNSPTYACYGYWAESTGGTYTATGLSGTAVTATPATVTLNTTLNLPGSGSVTMSSAGGTVTLTYTGTTATTLTGVTAAGGSGNYSSNTVTPPGYGATAALLTNTHVWGRHSIGIVADCQQNFANCQTEGGQTGQLLIRGGNCSWLGGKIFNPSGGNTSYGLQLGDTANQAGGTILEMPQLSGFAGGAAASAYINIVNSNSGRYSALLFLTSTAQAVYGTFQPGEMRRLYLTGTGTTPAVAAAGGMGTSPPAPTVSNATDNRGSVSWGTGTTPTAGSQVTFTWAQAKPGTPGVALWPMNSATALLDPYILNASSTGFTVGFGTAPAAGQAAGTYQIGYADTTE